MANLRDILANNLRENRKKCGLSQAKLSEKASISTQYIAMIEVSRKFPTPEVLERIAKALEIEAYELFQVNSSPESAMERLHDTLVESIGRVIGEAVEKALKAEGINKIALVVIADNESGNRFWEKQGFSTRPDLTYRNKSINDENL